MKPTYSPSALTSFEFCGYAYYIERVLKQRPLSNFSLVRGSAVHAARERNLEQKIETDADAPLGDMLDAARDYINQEFEEEKVELAAEPFEGKRAKAAAGYTIDETLPLVGLDLSAHQRDIHPLLVEHAITIAVDGFPEFDITMRLDCIERNGVVNDLKTGARVRSMDWAVTQYQPPLYLLGARLDVSDAIRWFRYDFVVKTKNGARKTGSIPVSYNEEALRSVLRRFRAMHTAIEHGVFLPTNQGNWKCSPAYCGHYRRCKYATTASERRL